MSNTKKSLLNENTIRRFMKLAEIDTLSDGFVDGLVQEEVAEVEEGMDMAYDRDEEDMSFEGDPEGPNEGPMVDADDEGMDMEEPEAPAEAPADHVELASAIEQLMDVISAMTGQEISVGPDTEAEAPAEAPTEDDLAAVDVDLDDEEVAADVMAEQSQDKDVHQEQLRRQAAYHDAIKQEVYRRVTARLQQESRKDAVADQLSERILARIKEQSKK